MCYKVLQRGKGGVKNYLKKRYIIFEWPLIYYCISERSMNNDLNTYTNYFMQDSVRKILGVCIHILMIYGPQTQHSTLQKVGTSFDILNVA